MTTGPTAGTRQRRPFMALDAIAVLFKLLGGIALVAGLVGAFIAYSTTDDVATGVAYVVIVFAGWFVVAVFMFAGAAAIDWMLRVEKHLRRIADR